MMLCRILITMVLLLGTSLAAHAEILATGGVWGGPTQVGASCIIFNAGTTSITFQTAEILTDDGTPVALATNTCDTLLPNRSCTIAATITNITAHSCKVSFDGSSTFIRGVFDIRRNDGVILVNSDTLVDKGCTDWQSQSVLCLDSWGID